MGHFNSKTLTEYLDARYSAGLSNEIKTHIDECHDCLERTAALKLTKKMLVSLEALEVSEGFNFEFNRRLNEVIAEREKPGVLERVTHEVLEGIKTVLLPPVPVLVKVAVSILLIATVLGTPYYFSKSPVNIMAVSGDTTVYSSRAQKWINASEGITLGKSDIVKTSSNSRIDIGVNGVFTVRLKENTELKTLSMLPRFRKGLASYEVAEGEVLVDIKEAFKGSKFKVYTPQAIANAIGTSFVMNISGGGEKDKTWLAVLDGAVEVESRYPMYVAKKVVVKAGQKTEVLLGKAPVPPSLLLEQEWEKLKELYQIGRIPRVMLLISATESRVRELLRPCSIYIYDVEPRTISHRLENAVKTISQAITEKSIEKHLDAIHELELMIEENPDREYNPQLLLFIGTYYEYISQNEEAIETFEKLVDEYPDSQFASLAQCAIGVIYNEKLGKKVRAREIFESVISNYPNSLEEFEAKKALGELKS